MEEDLYKYNLVSLNHGLVESYYLDEREFDVVTTFTSINPFNFITRKMVETTGIITFGLWYIAIIFNYIRLGSNWARIRRRERSVHFDEHDTETPKITAYSVVQGTQTPKTTVYSDEPGTQTPNIAVHSDDRGTQTLKITVHYDEQDTQTLKIIVHSDEQDIESLNITLLTD